MTDRILLPGSSGPTPGRRVPQEHRGRRGFQGQTSSAHESRRQHFYRPDPSRRALALCPVARRGEPDLLPFPDLGRGYSRHAGNDRNHPRHHRRPHHQRRSLLGRGRVHEDHSELLAGPARVSWSCGAGAPYGTLGAMPQVRLDSLTGDRGAAPICPGSDRRRRINSGSSGTRKEGDGDVV